MITSQPPHLCSSSPRPAISASGGRGPLTVAVAVAVAVTVTVAVAVAAGKDFVGSLVEKRADVKTGRRIKDAFTALHGTLRDVRPFEGADFDVTGGCSYGVI